MPRVINENFCELITSELGIIMPNVLVFRSLGDTGIVASDQGGNILSREQTEKLFSLVMTFHDHYPDLQNFVDGLNEAEIRYRKEAEENSERRRLSHTKVPIPEEMRRQILERDKYTCQKCGGNHILAIDHITPESKGGETIPENLQVLCKSCNSKKGNR